MCNLSYCVLVGYRGISSTGTRFCYRGFRYIGRLGGIGLGLDKIATQLSMFIVIVLGFSVSEVRRHYDFDILISNFQRLLILLYLYH